MSEAIMTPPDPHTGTTACFEVGSRVRPRGATIEGELLEFNAGATGALIRWDNGEEVWKALRNLEVLAQGDGGRDE